MTGSYFRNGNGISIDEAIAEVQASMEGAAPEFATVHLMSVAKKYVAPAVLNVTDYQDVFQETYAKRLQDGMSSTEALQSAADLTMRYAFKQAAHIYSDLQTEWPWR